MIIVVSWKEFLVDLKINTTADRATADALVEAMPNERTAYVADTVLDDWAAKAFSAFAPHGLVDLYNALRLPDDAEVRRFESKDVALRRIGYKIIERAREEAITVSSSTELVMPTTTKRMKYRDDQIVKVIAESNPKRMGSAAYDRFAKYRDGATVSATIAAGVGRGDLAWDAKHGYVSVE